MTGLTTLLLSVFCQIHARFPFHAYVSGEDVASTLSYIRF